MVCCTFIVLIIGLLRLLFLGSASARAPLAWRPGRVPVVVPRFSWAARGKSFIHAGRGLATVLREEHNARLHVLAAVIVVSVCLFLGLTPTEWAWIILSIAWVFFAEVFNTAIEHLCDVVSPGPHASVAKAKDIAAAGVLVSAFAACANFATIILPKLSALIAADTTLFSICGGG